MKEPLSAEEWIKQEYPLVWTYDSVPFTTVVWLMEQYSEYVNEFKNERE